MVCPSCGYKFHTDFKLVLKDTDQTNNEEEALIISSTVKPKSSFRIIV